MIKRFAMVLLLVMPTFSHASMDLDVGSQIKLTDRPGGPGGVNGGRFRVTGTLSGGGAITAFETFCVERGQFIGFGPTYTVTAIGTVNSTGGVLGMKAAWAYTQFRNGTLTGFDYSNSGTAADDSANALQHMIWEAISGVGTQGTLSVAATALKTGWETAYAAAVSNSEWTSIGNVRIMQLVGADGQGAQDQLVMVPEPMSIAIWGAILAMGGIAAVRFSRK